MTVTVVITRTFIAESDGDIEVEADASPDGIIEAIKGEIRRGELVIPQRMEAQPWTTTITGTFQREDDDRESEVEFEL